MKDGNLKVDVCRKCRERFVYNNNDTFWDYGYGYSVKLVKCPKCGTAHVIKYVEEKSLDVNNDARYY